MIVGIDLGTTNSLVGIWRHGEPVLVPNGLGELLTPSAVSLAENDLVLVGRPALERLVTHPMRTATAFKRYMGSAREMSLGSRVFRPEELSALVLRSLKADAEAYLGEPVREAVITVPAYFNDAQRKATRVAGELAGLEVQRLLTEPTAAALAYGLDLPDADQLVLVVDLGGGTFDVSLLQLFEGITEVRATAGDTHLGGEDFVDAIERHFTSANRDRGEATHLHSPMMRAAIRRQAEIAKCKLSDQYSVELSVNDDSQPIRLELSREVFEQLAEPLLARLRFPIERALRDSRVDPDRIAKVVLVGGASRMPMFRRLIGRIFRRVPLHGINPDEVVARGAAVRAGMLMRDVDLVERVMTDVAPFTLGTRIRRVTEGLAIDNVFAPIIERNTVIPASRVKRAYTSIDNQLEVSIDIYQGESQFVEDNISLGSLVVKVPPRPKGEEAIDIRFTYDPSGLLEVESQVLSTGVKQHLVIEGNPGVLTREEIAARLADLEAIKLNPRDQSENQLLMARGKRLYEEHVGADRHDIGRALVSFEGALESQDPDRIRRARETLARVLDDLDADPFA